MAEDIPTSIRLVKVFARVLAILIGGIGWLAASLGPEHWHLVLSVPLVFLAALLVREAQ